MCDIANSIAMPRYAVASDVMMTVTTMYIDMTLHVLICIGRAIRGYWLCLFMYILRSIRVIQKIYGILILKF